MSEGTRRLLRDAGILVPPEPQEWTAARDAALSMLKEVSDYQ